MCLEKREIFEFLRSSCLSLACVLSREKFLSNRLSGVLSERGSKRFGDVCRDSEKWLDIVCVLCALSFVEENLVKNGKI